MEEFVLARIGAPPARVLEVGCGEGELARALARAGHSVTAIDPRAPEWEPGGPAFQRTTIEEFSGPGPFDHVVASLSLHHVEDLAAALDKVMYLLSTGGTLIVLELAWDRIDEATAAWVLERLPPPSPSGKPSWLERRLRGRAHGGDGGHHGHGDHAGAHPGGWAEEGLHGSRRMLTELERRFVELHLEWVPYLYPDLEDGVSEADERAAIEAGTINAVGLRYVGTPAV
ncbi:MAG: class I SAM-dependent methyltransferase [Actinomycetota bacterium]|nr:class I SAM-dependent methyltransferase [Actinomycetota bacterium]